MLGRLLDRLAHPTLSSLDVPPPSPDARHASASFCGVDVPDDALLLILSHLSARDLCALGSTCRLLASLCAQTYPGIRLDLYPHQRASLAWMRRQEARRGGGILADEPGCGKTVTLLALLCQTAGQWVRPPPAAADAAALADEQWARLPLVYRRALAYRLLKSLRALHADAAAPLAPLCRDDALRALPSYSSLCRAAIGASDGAAAGRAALDGLLREEARRLAASHRGRRPADAPSAAASRATLLVAPRPLLGHWSEQLTWHLKPHALCGEVLVDAERGSLEQHFGAARLARCAVFLTSAERLSLEQRRMKAGEGSVLLQVRWLRVVVDEGHLFGGGAITNRSVLLHSLHAERRWLLTGTPAKGTSDADGVNGLRALLGFVRLADPRLEPQRVAVATRRFLKKEPGADAALLSLLQLAMIRHLKSQIRIPAPIYRTVRLRCSPSERLAYNTLVGYIRANLVLTAMEGDHAGAGREVSLLHAANLRSARVATENLRLTCNGGGMQVARLSDDNLIEARDWLACRYAAPPHVVSRACDFMRGARRGEARPCDRCALPLQLLLLFPTCGHLLCPECVDERTTCCPACAAPLPAPTYLKCARCDLVHCSHEGTRKAHTAHPLDAFAYLQPGFELEWAETRHEQESRRLAELYVAARRAEGGAPPRGAPAAAAAAAAAAGGGEAEAFPPSRELDNTKAQYIISRIAQLRREGGGARGGRPVKVLVYSENKHTLNNLGHFLYLRFGDDAVAQFWGKYRTSELNKFRASKVNFWRCHACPPRQMAAGEASRREVEWPEVRCYGKHLTVHIPADAGGEVRVLVLNEEDVRGYTPGVRWHVGQWVDVREAAGRPWRRACVAQFNKCNARMAPSTCWEERHAECFVLLLTRDGSHGLDLSKVTHIFLADQCWDLAVEDQVISRAFRMGATESVEVEQLLMQGTVEDTLHSMVHHTSGTPPAAEGETPPLSADCAPLPPASSPTRAAAEGAARSPSPIGTPSARALGKRPMPPAETPEEPAQKRSALSSRLHTRQPPDDSPSGGDPIDDEARAAGKPTSDRSHDEAKIHRLLRTMRFLREPGEGSDPHAALQQTQPHLDLARKKVTFAE